MRIRFQKQKREQGGVLMVTFFIACFIGIALCSSLLLVSSQNTVVARSKAWNGALGMAEAGGEEAVAQLNPGATAETITVDRTANGWGASSGGFYGPITGRLTNSSYTVVFTDATFPIIYSTGYVTVPSISATLTRVVRVATTNVPLFNVSMAALTNVTDTGNGLATDSFDSANTNLSTNGSYDPAKTSTNGNVAYLYGTVNLGGHTINGSVFLGPTANLAGGTVTGSVHNDLNIDFPQVVMPSGAGSWTTLALATPGIVGGVLYNNVFLTSGDYIIPSLSGTIYVAPSAKVRLKVLSGNTGAIKIAGTGAASGSLTIYMAAPSFSIVGNASVDSGNAANLTYYGLPSNTSITFSGSATFTGTIYAPSADMTMNGGGGSSYNFVGSSITRSVTIHGNFMFHWDQNLLNASPSRGYLAVSWREI